MPLDMLRDLLMGKLVGEPELENLSSWLEFWDFYVNYFIPLFIILII